MRVLLVEDEPHAAQVLAKGLREHAYAVDLAPDGGAAVVQIGTTDYDADAKALASLLAEWGSANDYATRIAHLTGSMTGGKNGLYFLNADPANGKVTVHDNHPADNSNDNLQGGTGMDWYFKGMMDVYFNKTTDETVTPIS